MGRMPGKWCRKCALDQPHPFRHWHIRCRMCRKFKVYRGPSCAPCTRDARAIVADIIDQMIEEGGSGK